jgi:endonuclease-3
MLQKAQEDVTYPAARKLFENFSTPREMEMADVSKIESLTRYWFLQG